MTRRILIGAFVSLLGILVAVQLTAADVLQVIPSSWTPWIILIKGAFATIGVILLLWHMDREWTHLGKEQPDRKLRYITLLAYGVLQTGASTGQLADNVELEWRHLGGFLVSILFLATSIISVRWSLQRDRTDV